MADHAGARPTARRTWWAGLKVLLLLVVLAGSLLVACGGKNDAEGQGGPVIVVGGPGCSDARSATEAASPSTPLCTIGQALKLATAGTTVTVRGGTYPALTVSGGSRAGFVTVAPYGGEQVQLPSILLTNDASFLRFQGLHLTGDSSRPSFRVQEGHSHDVQLVSSDVRSDNQDAIDLRWGTSNVLIEANHISSGTQGGGGNGLTFSSQSDFPGVPDPSSPRAPISNVVVRNNHFDGIGTDAIRPANFDNLVIEGNEINGVIENGDHNDATQIVWGGKHFVYRNNYLHDNQGQGLFIKDGRVWDATIENNLIVHETKVRAYDITIIDTIGVKLVNNTVWDTELGVVLYSSIRDGVVRNNIFHSLVANDPAGLAGNVDQDYNLIADGWNWGARGPHDIKAQPRFVNAAANDYRLAAGSPGVDAGTALGAPPLDRACRERFDVPGVANTGGGSPNYVDMGALEQRPDSTPADVRGGACGTPPGGAGAGAGGAGAGAGAGAGTGGAGCACTAAKGGKWRPKLAVRRVRVRGRWALVTLRARSTCRVLVVSRAQWRRGNGHRAKKRLKAVRRRLSGARATVRLRLPKKAVGAHRHGRRIVLRLRVRMTSCSGRSRVVSRKVVVRHR